MTEWTLPKRKFELNDAVTHNGRNWQVKSWEYDYAAQTWIYTLRSGVRTTKAQESQIQALKK